MPHIQTWEQSRIIRYGPERQLNQHVLPLITPVDSTKTGTPQTVSAELCAFCCLTLKNDAYDQRKPIRGETRQCQNSCRAEWEAQTQAHICMRSCSCARALDVMEFQSFHWFTLCSSTIWPAGSAVQCRTGAGGCKSVRCTVAPLKGDLRGISNQNLESCYSSDHMSQALVAICIRNSSTLPGKAESWGNKRFFYRHRKNNVVPRWWLWIISDKNVPLCGEKKCVVTRVETKMI